MKKKLLSVKNLLRTLWILFAVLSTVFWVPKIDQMLTKDYALIADFVSLDDSWSITINDDTFQNVSLNEFRFPAVKKGSRIVMQRELPEDWEPVEGVLRLSVRQSAVKVFVDDEMIYEYGYDRVEQHKTVGSGYQFINFPEEYQGRSLTIHLYVAEDKAFTNLNPVRIYAWENAYRVLVTENRLPLFLGSFLVIFGLAVCIMTVFAIAFSWKYLRLLCISLFSVFMGLWTVCYYRVIEIYAIPLYAISLMEYIALYLAPLSLIVYMREDVKNLKKKAFHISYNALLAFYVAVFAVMMILHGLDIVHLAAMLPYMAAIIIFCMVFFTIVIIMNLKSGSAVNRLYLAGMLIIVCCIAYDLISYGSERYYANNFLTAVKGVSSIGVMIFIFILSLSFYIDMTQKMMLETERNSLIKSAYTDELTQLHNRRYCMERMAKMREEKNADYSIVCFDLNNLKMMNDTYGHAKGDILIRSAADVLAETFGAYGVVARMGGDEFIAIIDTADEAKLEAMMKQLQENISKKNRQTEDLNLSIACGCASGRENDDIEKVYQMADDRMYVHKKQMKSTK